MTKSQSKGALMQPLRLYTETPTTVPLNQMRVTRHSTCEHFVFRTRSLYSPNISCDTM